MLGVAAAVMSRLMESSASEDVELDELEWQPELGKTPESEEDAEDEERSNSFIRFRLAR